MFSRPDGRTVQAVRTASGTPNLALSGFQRLLVGYDGTVTTLLQAYAGEPLEAVKVRQRSGPPSPTEAVALDVDERTTVLHREVVLRGARTSRPFLHAEAVVVVERVHPLLIDALQRTQQPIGHLLAADRTETFREILEVGTELAGAAGVHFGVAPTADTICRSYRIRSGGHPIILVTEQFSPHMFSELPSAMAPMADLADPSELRESIRVRGGRVTP